MLGTWDRVLLSRRLDRPTTLDYIELMASEYIELHGDRYYGDDRAIVGGIAIIDNIPWTFIGHQRGKNITENTKYNYGMAHPEGYRKALRLAKQAEKFNRPIVTFIDTSGAYPGIESEERGISRAIADNLMHFSTLKTIIINIVIGEGGSGGAIGIGVGDKLFMLENSIYSVISPEGFASILLKNTLKVNEIADSMKITAEDLKEFKLIDKIIKEADGGAHIDPSVSANNIKNVIIQTYKKLKSKNINNLINERSEKILSFGAF